VAAEQAFLLEEVGLVVVVVVPVAEGEATGVHERRHAVVVA
jgi:hypothetical protein